MKITAHMYNHHLKTRTATRIKNGNNPDPGVVFGKILSDNQKEALVWDVERGAPNKIMERPWQCCNCLGDWHYNTSTYEHGRYKSAATVVKLLVVWVLSALR